MSLRRTALFSIAVALMAASPAAAASPERIPASIGSQGKGGFLVSTSGIPADVGLERFDEIVRSSARRWGLRARAYTTRLPGYRDRRSVVGFGTALPSEALAVQRDYAVRLYRLRKRCARKGRRLACRTVRRYIGERVVERDITVRPDGGWQPGPGYPSAEQFDLETVLIHELGHFAGNKQHVPRCTNSPLMESLAPGEWWRSQSDWHVDGCVGLARVSRARIAHRRVVVGSRTL